MGLWDKLRNELIDIVEWLDDTRDTLAWRFPRYENEIKNGAKLIVREGQAAVFVQEGKLADVFGPGTYTLETRNLPLLSTIAGWKYGFESPIKAEVYFVSTRTFTDRKWGTKNPIILRDPEFGMVRVRAFGNAAYRCSEPAVLVKNLVGTDSRLTVEDLGDQLRDLLVARFTDAIAEAKIAALDLASRQDEIAATVRQKMSADFSIYGLEIVQLFIENVSMPPEVEAAIDKRTSMGVIGNMQTFQQYQTGQAIEQAAKNPGGLGSIGAGLGAGATIAAAMGQATVAAGQAPPPMPGTTTSLFVAINGSQVGPLDHASLQQRIASGDIKPDSLVWKAGMPSWSPASSLPEVASLFAPVPPPLPH